MVFRDPLWRGAPVRRAAKEGPVPQVLRLTSVLPNRAQMLPKAVPLSEGAAAVLPNHKAVRQLHLTASPPFLSALGVCVCVCAIVVC